MSAMPLGSLAINLVGGGQAASAFGSRVGISAGIAQEITRRIIDMVAGAIRRFITIVQSAVRKVLSERQRLAGLDPTMAAAEITAKVNQLLRDIGRARALGPGMLRLTEQVERLKNAAEPLIRYLIGEVTDALTGIVRLINDVLAPAMRGMINEILGSVQAFVVSLHGLAAMIQTVLPGRGAPRMNPKTGELEFQPMPGFQKMMEQILEWIQGIRKSLEEANDADRFNNANTIFMDDLRFLTKDATRYGTGQSELIGPRGRDLFDMGGFFPNGNP